MAKEYIEKNEFFDAIRAEFYDIMPTGSEVLSRMLKFPAADVRENVKGELDMDSVAFYRKCPNCKCCVRDNRYEVFLDNGDLHFCPNCGAKMVGGAEDG